MGKEGRERGIVSVEKGTKRKFSKIIKRGGEIESVFVSEGQEGRENIKC